MIGRMKAMQMASDMRQASSPVAILGLCGRGSAEEAPVPFYCNSHALGTGQVA